MGNTIKKAINSGSRLPSSHTRAKMMNEATGVAFTAATGGSSSSRTQAYRDASAAKTAAVRQESRKPPRIRQADQPTARQKAAVAASSPSRAKDAAGDASSNPPWG